MALLVAKELGVGKERAATEVDAGAEAVGMLKKAEIWGMVLGCDQ